VKSTGPIARLTYYPKHLTTYERCPERFYLEVEKKLPKPIMPFDAARERGRVIHNILNNISAEYSEHKEVPTNIAERASAALSRDNYSSDDEWMNDVEIVVREVDYGLRQFDDGVDVLASEHEYSYRHHQDDDDPFFILSAKPDLVLRRCDEDGLPIVDIVDFKSGKGRMDSIQEIVTRIVVEKNANRLRTQFNYIRNTTVKTGVPETASVVLEPEDYDYRWQHVKGLVKEILERDDFPPNKNALCRWCPYRINGCTLAPDEFDDG
jgi:CRISPR/Cas system-associated exonuclease Cas4 (RecB family)